MSSDPPAASAQETTAQQLAALTQNLPGLMRAVNAQISPNELAQLEASKLTSPGYAALQDQLLKTFGISMNDTANTIADTNAAAGASRDLNVLKQYGTPLAAASLEAAKVADPEYYANREALGKQFLDLLGNGARLSGSEVAQIERGNRAMNADNGNLYNDSATNTAINLSTFGKAGSDKLMNALQLVTAGLPALKSGVDTNLVTTGKQSTIPNNSMLPTLGARQSAGEQAASFGQSLLSETGANARQTNQINANRRSGFDRTMGAVGGITSGFGNIFSPIKLFGG